LLSVQIELQGRIGNDVDFGVSIGKKTPVLNTLERREFHSTISAIYKNSEAGNELLCRAPVEIQPLLYCRAGRSGYGIILASIINAA